MVGSSSARRIVGRSRDMAFSYLRFDCGREKCPLSAQRERILGEKSLVRVTRLLVRNDARGRYGLIQLKEFMIVVKTADSAFLSNSGGGVLKAPGLAECRTNVRLMQAVLRTVEYATQS